MLLKVVYFSRSWNVCVIQDFNVCQCVTGMNACVVEHSMCYNEFLGLECFGLTCKMHHFLLILLTLIRIVQPCFNYTENEPKKNSN